MRKTLVVTLFMLATMAWAAAQQPGMGSGRAGSQGPGAGSMQSQTPGATSQGPGQAGSPMANGPVTEGCLGGSNPNYTITDNSGNTYKLNIPAGADTTKLAAHVGESVNVAGNVNGSGKASSIDVTGIGRGAGTCPAGSSKGDQSQPKQ
jgi:hypothetical protein